MIIEIDSNSGFCFGVVEAIHKAEETLRKQDKLYCLGDIVHNNAEIDRLTRKGLITINHEEFFSMKNTTVLLRAHGEPPSTYEYANKNNIRLIIHNFRHCFKTVFCQNYFTPRRPQK